MDQKDQKEIEKIITSELPYGYLRIRMGIVSVILSFVTITTAIISNILFYAYNKFMLDFAMISAFSFLVNMILFPLCFIMLIIYFYKKGSESESVMWILLASPVAFFISLIFLATMSVCSL